MSNTKLEQIKKKYKAPEYRPYSNFDLHFAIITLGVWGIVFFASYFLFFPEPPPQESLIATEPDEYAFDRIIHQYVNLAILLPGIYLLIKARRLSKEIGISNQIIFNENEIPRGTYITVVGLGWLVFSVSMALWYAHADVDHQNDQFWFHFFVSVYLILIPAIVTWSRGSDLSERLEIRRELESSDKRKNDWETALKCEQNNQFDDAARIWTDLGEEGEAERVTRIKAEGAVIILEEKIQELKSKGIDTVQLEEQLVSLEKTMKG